MRRTLHLDVNRAGIAIVIVGLTIAGIIFALKMGSEPHKKPDTIDKTTRIELVRRAPGNFDDDLLGQQFTDSQAALLNEADKAYASKHYGETAAAYRKLYRARYEQLLLAEIPAEQQIQGFRRTYAQLMTGNLTAAQTWAEAAIREGHSLAEAFYIRGHVGRQQGRLRSAAESFERSWKEDRTFIQSALSRATTLVLLEDFANARTAFYQALGTDYYATSIEDYLGLLDAIEALSRRREANPSDLNAQVLLGLALRYLIIYDPAKVSEAEALAQAVLKRASDNPDALVTLGVLARKRQDLQSAERSFRRAVASDPRHAYAWWMLGIVLDWQGRKNEALKAFQTARALDETEPNFVQAEADTLWLLDRFQDALPTAERAVKLNPHEPTAWLVLGRVYQALDRDPEALAAFRQGLTLDPTSPYLLYGVAAQLHRDQRYEEAIKYYKASIIAGSSDHWPYFHLGNILLWLRRFGEAAQVLETASQLFPASADIHKSLGHLYHATGRMAEGDREFNRAKSLEKTKK